MTESELQEEAGILNLACGQLGNELAQGRLQVAANVHRQLGAILKKFASLEQHVATLKATSNGRAEVKPALDLSSDS